MAACGPSNLCWGAGHRTASTSSTPEPFGGATGARLRTDMGLECFFALSHISAITMILQVLLIKNIHVSSSHHWCHHISLVTSRLSATCRAFWPRSQSAIGWAGGRRHRSACQRWHRRAGLWRLIDLRRNQAWCGSLKMLSTQRTLGSFPWESSGSGCDRVADRCRFWVVVNRGLDLALEQCWQCPNRGVRQGRRTIRPKLSCCYAGLQDAFPGRFSF